MPAPTPTQLALPHVPRLHAYTPGLQPTEPGWVKLNTNECPYPPSPRVAEALHREIGTDGASLRLYPNPPSTPLRAAVARLHGLRPEQVCIGNGSDDILNLLVRVFGGPDAAVGFTFPSYSLYPVLAHIHGARLNAVPLEPDFGLPTPRFLKGSRTWDFGAALTFVTTPNAPSGRGYTCAELETICQLQKGVVMLDEAYVDFAAENALSLALAHPHVLVARTFSKAYSLCFQRVGYAVGHPELIAALHKVRDSYNVNGLGQVAALATLDDLPYYRKNFQKIIATRERLSRSLAELGFEAGPSSTNFIFARPPRFSAEEWLQKLRDRKILVRWWAEPIVRDFLRITVGTDAEADALLGAAKALLR